MSEMKFLMLLIDERIEKDGSQSKVSRDIYELPQYKERYEEKEIEEFLQSELNGHIEVMFVGTETVIFELDGRRCSLKFQRALKFGRDYLKLDLIRKNEIIVEE